MGLLVRGFIACALVVAALGCTRTKVVTREVPVEIEVPIAVPVIDTSFVQSFAWMDGYLARVPSLDTLSAGAPDSKILEAASIDLQHARNFSRSIRRWIERMREVYAGPPRTSDGTVIEFDE